MQAPGKVAQKVTQGRNVAVSLIALADTCGASDFPI
jgi:hypothetical protein